MMSTRPIGRAHRAALVQTVASIASEHGEHRAAALLLTTDPDDDIFNNYLGPAIDELIDDYAGLAAEAVCAAEEEPAEPNALSARILHNAWSGQVVAWTVHRDEDALDDWEHEHLDDDPRAEMFGADLVVADDVEPTVRNPAMFVEFFGTAAVLVASDRKTLWSMREQWAAEHGDADDPRRALTRQSEFRIQLEQSH